MRVVGSAIDLVPLDTGSVESEGAARALFVPSSMLFAGSCFNSYTDFAADRRKAIKTLNRRSQSTQRKKGREDNAAGLGAFRCIGLSSEPLPQTDKMSVLHSFRASTPPALARSATFD